MRTAGYVQTTQIKNTPQLEIQKPEPPIQTTKEKITKYFAPAQCLVKNAMPVIHTALDIAGLLPVVGEPLDAINAAIYLAQGDNLNAGLSAASMIPVVGSLGIVAKGGNKVAKTASKSMVQSLPDVYYGVKQASSYLKSQGVPRAYRKQILESFDVRTIKLETANNSTYGLRFYGGNATPEGRYLFETFSDLTNRQTLALPHQWNAMTGIQQFQVKAGTKMITGRTAAQSDFGVQYVGGAKQWYINNLKDLIK